MALVPLTEAAKLDHFTAEHDQTTEGANFKLTLWWVGYLGHERVEVFTEHTFTTADPPLTFWTETAPADLVDALALANYEQPSS